MNDNELVRCIAVLLVMLFFMVNTVTVISYWTYTRNRRGETLDIEDKIVAVIVAFLLMCGVTGTVVTLIGTAPYLHPKNSDTGSAVISGQLKA